jgi:hypothetical protein
MKRDGIDFQAAAATVMEDESKLGTDNKARAHVKKPTNHSSIKREKPFEGRSGRGIEKKPASHSPGTRGKPVERKSSEIDNSLLSRLLEYKVMRPPRSLVSGARKPKTQNPTKTHIPRP